MMVRNVVLIREFSSHTCVARRTKKLISHTSMTLKVKLKKESVASQKIRTTFLRQKERHIAREKDDKLIL